MMVRNCMRSGVAVGEVVVFDIRFTMLEIRD
jgi:hypothetical protein